MTSSWLSRHNAALREPTTQEQPYVELMTAIVRLTALHRDDNVLREGVAKLIDGAALLLNAEWGRLDRGACSQQLEEMALLMHYDTARERFTD